ncbi:sensor histidine kinase [Pseudanabaena sp. FACHB-2040]|uniref:sensor histidine kinase n=1 Tax=Pseudanabaena sp. FACHB-2040 TaxID=2692859 RepID=UPI001A7E7BD0|nr:sensor histidine kinase [Pseudanabaena sp. FACHB-2040]
MFLVIAVVITLNGFGQTSASEFYVTFASLAACALLSLRLPTDRPLWQRRLYIGLSVLALLPTRFFSGWNLEILLYLIVAKSCFLLKRRDVILLVITMAIVWQVGLIWSFTTQWEQTVAHIRANTAEYLNHPERALIAQLINDVGSYIAASTFSVLLSFAWISENRSRQQAMILAQQVRTLTATLERTRIARDIHDSLGYGLTNLDSELAVIHQKLHQHGVNELTQAVEAAQFLSRQCIEDVSHALQTIRQSENFDLNQILLSLVEQVRCRPGLNVRWEVNLPQLPLQTSHHIYCIVREGLTNIQKHAKASQIYFRTCSTAESIILELEDDGQGFDRAQTPSGFGLRGIEERVQLLKGRLTITSSLGSGTKIFITLPL